MSRGRDESAVLTDGGDRLVRRPCQKDRPRDPVRLVDGPNTAEQCLVDLRLPRSEPRACPGADVATAVADDTLIVPHPLADLEREIVLRVAEDITRTRHHAGGAARAQPGVDDLAVQLTPMDIIHRASPSGHRDGGASGRSSPYVLRGADRCPVRAPESHTTAVLSWRGSSRLPRRGAPSGRSSRRTGNAGRRRGGRCRSRRSARTPPRRRRPFQR